MSIVVVVIPLLLLFRYGQSYIQKLYKCLNTYKETCVYIYDKEIEIIATVNQINKNLIN